MSMIWRSSSVRSAVAKIDGWSVNVQSQRALIGNIRSGLAAGAPSFFICTLNLDHLVKLRRDSLFRRAYSHAAYVSADGFPIVLLARPSGFPVERTTGADLIEPVCDLAAREDLPIFLVGSTLAALCAGGAYLWRVFPALDIRGVHAPPQDFDLHSKTADELIALIRNSGARICFVALGAPKQEIFCARAVSALETSGICFLPIGAGLDFLAGTQRRSPKLLQKLNLEWAWRLANDPRRLFKRYFLCALLFAELVARHYLRSSKAE